MKPAVLTLALVTAALSSGPLQGTWAGNVDTPHGAAPLQLAVSAADTAATFEMTFLGTALRGRAESWKVTGDSVWFTVPFTTNMGPAEFRFTGRAVGSTLSGSYVGLAGGQEMNRGSWSLARR